MMCMCGFVCVHVCLCVCACVRVRACACVCVCAGCDGLPLQVFHFFILLFVGVPGLFPGI